PGNAANPSRPPAPSRAAATVIVVRDADAGMQVLLMRRVERSNDRSSGAFVFPGGTLDKGDRALHGWCTGVDDAAASARLKLEATGLDYFVAAIRECFEEAGLLFATDPSDRLTDFAQVAPAEVSEMRGAIRRGALTLDAVCTRLGVRLAVDRLAYHSHWLTPAGLPKRFDTRFFVALAPPGQSASFDQLETLEHRWIRPADALADALGARLPNATRQTLESIRAFSSAAECFAHAQALRNIEIIM